MRTTRKTGLKPLLHIPDGDRCAKNERVFCNWSCSQQNPCLLFLWFSSSSLGLDFETDDSENKTVNFQKNTLWRYFKFSQPMILFKIWRRFLYIGLWWIKTSLGFLKCNYIWLKQFFECDVWNSPLETLKHSL